MTPPRLLALVDDYLALRRSLGFGIERLRWLLRDFVRYTERIEHRGPITIDLAEVATDPDGDSVFYRIVSALNGTARLAPDGRSVTFMPAPGYTGDDASLEIVADDGFSASPDANVQIVVSDKPLVALDFDVRRLLLSGTGRGFEPVRRADGGITIRLVRALVRAVKPG